MQRGDSSRHAAGLSAARNLRYRASFIHTTRKTGLSGRYTCWPLHECTALDAVDLPASATLLVRPLPSSPLVEGRSYYAVGERLHLECVPGAVGSRPIDVAYYLLPSTLASSSPIAELLSQRSQAAELLNAGAGAGAAALALAEHEVTSDLLVNASFNGRRIFCSARNIATREFFPLGILSEPFDLHVHCAFPHFPNISVYNFTRTKTRPLRCPEAFN